LNAVRQFLVGKTEEKYEKQVGVAGSFTEIRNTFHSIILALVYSGGDRFYLCPEQVKIIVAAPNRNRGFETNRNYLLNFPSFGSIFQNLLRAENKIFKLKIFILNPFFSALWTLAPGAVVPLASIPQLRP